MWKRSGKPGRATYLPVKGGLVGGGGESSASPSIVLSVASATHFPTYARVHAREACPRARLPAVNPAERRERRLYLPPSSCLSPPPPPPPFRVIELYSTLLHRNGNARRRYRRTVGDTLLRTKEGNVRDIDPWEKRGDKRRRP